MNKRKICFLKIILLLCSSYSFAQTELINVTPLSPNAASLAKYIESPVGSFTGVPPISLPLFSVKTGDININLSLSYHAGGNRVESIASWVGLGWSLTGIPSISRQAKDIRDEGTGGFFFKPAAQETVKYIYENKEQPGVNFHDLLGRAVQDLIDTEPDIFSYNLISESGKFFYNQDTETFNEFPNSNIRISKSGSGYVSFIITDEQGISYHFDMLENSIVQGSTINTDPPVTSTWYPSMIISSSRKDTVFFEYTSENQQFRSNFGSTYLIPLHLDGDLIGWTSDINSNSLYRNNFATTHTTTLLPDKIRFSQGTIHFNKQVAEREDLEGGHLLEGILLKDNNANVISEYAFSHSYLLSSYPHDDAMYSISNSRERKYLLLDSITEKTVNFNKTHAFKYNRENVPACRISTAQDDWGYYNGKKSNNTLMPIQYIMHHSIDATVPLSQSDGSDRRVDTVYNQFAILSAIEYPTGGKTTYTFESNKSTDPIGGELKKNYKTEFAAIEAANPEQQTWPVNAFYQTTFAINNPPDTYLNNSSPGGGAFVHIDAGYFGCDLTNGSSTCAQIAIRNLNSNTAPVYMPIYATEEDNFTDLTTYLPNGEYVIEATFNQDPPLYNNFYIALTWYSIDSSMDNTSSFVGGLRVKKISHYSSKEDEQPALETEYRYTIGLDLTKSSGEMFSEFSPVYSKRIETSKGDYQQLNASPTIQHILESGSCVGYTKVFSIVKSADLSQQSIIETNYLNAPDEFDINIPFPLLQNNELIRGKMDSEIKYSYRNNVLMKVAEKRIEYEYKDTVEKKPYSLIVDHYRIGTPSQFTPWSSGSVIYNAFYYYPSYSFLQKKETNKIYSSENDALAVETVTEYVHDPIYFHVKEDNTILSNLDVRKNIYFRPYDLGQSDTYYQQLVDQNQVSRVVKTETFVKGALTQATQVKFNNFNGITLPWEVFRKKRDFDFEKVVEFTAYDNHGNILEQSKANDVKEVYLWGYNGQYPVAKILNTTYQTASSFIDQNILDDPADDNILRNHLANLRSIPGALVTTYTFKPLIGISSETNPNGRITYYEYDDFGRLKLIRDQDMNILKTFDYKYQANANQ